MRRLRGRGGWREKRKKKSLTAVLSKRKKARVNNASLPAVLPRFLLAAGEQARVLERALALQHHLQVQVQHLQLAEKRKYERGVGCVSHKHVVKGPHRSSLKENIAPCTLGHPSTSATYITCILLGEKEKKMMKVTDKY